MSSAIVHPVACSAPALALLAACLAGLVARVLSLFTKAFLPARLVRAPQKAGEAGEAGGTGARPLVEVQSVHPGVLAGLLEQVHRDAAGLAGVLRGLGGRSAVPALGDRQVA